MVNWKSEKEKTKGKARRGRTTKSKKQATRGLELEEELDQGMKKGLAS